ncbi:MAG: GAF domain-containing protein, partial [Anaerolineae bacterium]|nr:GAF domain-containing protein [Anaerolineae bacterium]
PHTRSEGALPLRSRGQVIGALSVQSAKPAVFDDETVAVLQLMADQVAVALDNARLFTESRVAAETARRAYGAVTVDGWREMVRARPLGYRYSEHKIVPVAEAPQPEETAPGDLPTLELPVMHRDQTFGSIVAQKHPDAGKWTTEEVTLMKTLAEQLSVALESARLYQDTQRRAAREQLTREVTDNIRAATTVDEAIQRAMEELGRVLAASQIVARIGPEDRLSGGNNGAE